MALITWPAGVALRSVQWRQTWPRLVQRSEFTNRRRIAMFGACPLWTAECELPPMTRAKADALRAFLSRLAVPGNTTRLVAVEAPQNPAATGVASATGTTPVSLGITGLPASATILRAGQMIQVWLANGDTQLLVLNADLVSNGSGYGLAQFDVPLRSAAAIGSGVEMNLPFAHLEAGEEIMAWAAAPGTIYSASGFTLTEAI